jgi:hypothetical protein
MHGVAQAFRCLSGFGGRVGFVLGLAASWANDFGVVPLHLMKES